MAKRKEVMSFQKSIDGVCLHLAIEIGVLVWYRNSSSGALSSGTFGGDQRDTIGGDRSEG
jgi:hypothetical protein